MVVIIDSSVEAIVEVHIRYNYCSLVYTRPNWVERVFIPKLSAPRSLYIAAFGLDMLDEGYLWQQQDMDLKARTLHGWLNGMHGVGSTNQDWLINVPYRETAAAHTGSDEYQAICRK
ncbi:predicted protein [Lichtheimia corymbifera JMRC:FSU:9682]|uniref:Uncharacterized protein n=1 Tax=Lichtheimia corymbifera JMRC:FSU:9682 TaxID=1263082 RepID=A0A068RU65_9FUNG|nr:predicted protein [Lichtheimia corymbifera JMRC:FSU:9682]